MEGEDNRYFTKQDPQYRTIKNMIERLAQQHDASWNYYDHHYELGTAYAEGEQGFMPGTDVKCKTWIDCEDDENGACFFFGFPGSDPTEAFEAAVDCEKTLMDWDGDGKTTIMIG